MKLQDIGMFRHALLAVLVVGLLLRLWHYLQFNSFWADEAFLVYNIAAFPLPDLLHSNLNAVSQDFDHGGAHQIAPPLFLLVQKWLHSIAGSAEWTLRLHPLVASGGALVVLYFILRHSSQRITPVASVLALASVAFAPKLIQQAANAKQYSSDTLAAALLLAAAYMIQSHRRAVVTCLLGTAVLIWYSYPVAVIGFSVAFARFLIGCMDTGHRRRPFLLLSGAAGLTAVVSLFICLRMVVSRQRVAFLDEYWAEGFLTLGQLYTLPKLLPEVVSGMSAVLSIGLVVTLLAVVVLRWVVRVPVGLTRYDLIPLAPIVLAVIASITHSMPLVPGRVTMYLMPVFVLLLARLTTCALESLPERLPIRRYAGAAIGVLIAVNLLLTTREIFTQTLSTGNARAIATTIAPIAREQNLPIATLIAFTGDQVTLRLYGVETLPLKQAYADLPPGGKLWAVTSHPPSPAGQPRFLKRFNAPLEGAITLQTIQLHGAQARLVQKPPTPAP
jgi:hypothetical protein